MATRTTQNNILRELHPVESGTVLSSNNNLPLTPPSPDESLIQLRGFQRKSATYNYAAPDPVFFKSPTKSPKKTSVFDRLSTPTRSSPRKKLNLNSPEKKICDNTLMKKRLLLQNMNHIMHSEKHLKALSHAQLIHLIDEVLKAVPSVKETLMSLVPVPDLTPVEARLKGLQHNVLRCYPRNIWGNQDGSFSFLRVRGHLEAFKKECLDYGRQLMESQYWPSVFEYILIAWKLAMGLPDWPTSSYNKIKSSCTKYLANMCIGALKKSNIDETSLNEVIQRLEELGDSTDVKACVTFAKDLLK